MTREPLPTENLFSLGAQRTKRAARLIRRMTSVGFHVLQRPHIGIAVCAAGHNVVTLRGAVDACHLPVVLLQLVHLVPLGTALLIDVHLMVIGAQGDLWKGKQHNCQSAATPVVLCSTGENCDCRIYH